VAVLFAFTIQGLDTSRWPLGFKNDKGSINRVALSLSHTWHSIPARLSDGEFVFTKKATDQLGADQLQTMMDDAEKAYDGGLMKKAFGGMVDDSVDESRMGMYSDEEEEIKKQMIDANRMPSVR
jgi:hypothetical protein